MQTSRLQLDVPIRGTDGLKIGDFWSWAFSDVLGNTVRGVFAEFLVAAALGITDTPRIEWDAVDLRCAGKSIEIKAAAYCQSWPQERSSPIKFDIARKRGWDAATNTWLPGPKRYADCYVFCLFTERDAEFAASRVLDATAWKFYILSTSSIDSAFGNQKSVSLSRLEEMTDPVTFGQIRDRVRAVLGSQQ